MRDGGLVGVGIVFGWLMSKSWNDPGCRLGLVIFLIATAVMFLGFALAVVGHGRETHRPDHQDEDDRD